MTVRVSVSGAAFHAALDPRASSVPTESGWPSGTFHRRGRGVTVAYELTAVQAAEMADHLETVADGFAYGDAFTRREGRACAAAAARIRAAVAADV